MDLIFTEKIVLVLGRSELDFGITSYLATLLWRKNDDDYFPQKLRVRIKDNNNLPNGKFHQFLFPFSSRFLDLTFASYVFDIYLCFVRVTHSEPGLPMVRKAFEKSGGWEIFSFVSENKQVVALENNKRNQFNHLVVSWQQKLTRCKKIFIVSGVDFSRNNS